MHHPEQEVDGPSKENHGEERYLLDDGERNRKSVAVISIVNPSFVLYFLRNRLVL